MLTKEVMIAMRARLNAVAKEYGAKLSIRKARNTLRITILSSPIDFYACALHNNDKYHLDEWKNTTAKAVLAVDPSVLLRKTAKAVLAVDPYCYKKHWSGEALELIDKLLNLKRITLIQHGMLSCELVMKKTNTGL